MLDEYSCITLLPHPLHYIEIESACISLYMIKSEKDITKLEKVHHPSLHTEILLIWLRLTHASDYLVYISETD